MSYATPQMVADLFRMLDLTKTDTAVTTTKIQRWLDQAFVRINARLSMYYSLNPEITQPTYPEAFLILQEIETFYVAGIVDDILNTYTQGDKKPMWEKRANESLNFYAPEDCTDCAPRAQLPDVPYLGSSTQQGRFKASNTTTAPTFVKGANNW